MKKLKRRNILFVLTPLIKVMGNLVRSFNGLKQCLIEFNFWESKIGWAIKLYLLTIVIPIVSMLFHVFGCILIPDKMRFGFFEGIWESWYSFYISGYFLDIVAWRWQIILLFISFIITIFNNDE